MPLPKIEPPLINSANPWATSRDDLRVLYASPHTGAVTTRTSLLKAFPHDPAIHQYAFFDPSNHGLQPRDAKDGAIPHEDSGSLNTLGYSPIPLQEYLSYVKEIADEVHSPPSSRKPFIISVTGSPAEVAECYSQILDWQDYGPICMEINLSCPNIPSKPPPAYSRSALLEYFDALQRYGPYRSAQHIPPGRSVPIGIKTPPYTYADQFHSLISALMSVVEREGGAPIDFITATNTLGSCLLLTDSFEPALASASGAGVGGLAGAPLHPLALGNVKTLRTMLDQHETLRTVDIIGIGGVSDRAGFDRMQNVGAKVVGVGTALGREGTDVFRKILTG